MRILRLALPLILALTFSFGTSLSNFIYSLTFDKNLYILGDLSKHEVNCDAKNCHKKYSVETTALESTSVNAIGIGIINGQSSWYCEDDNGSLVNLYSTPNHNSTYGAIKQQYHFFSIPSSCKKNILGIVPQQEHTAIARIGWRGGSLVLSSIEILTGYKNFIDFFNVYSRLLIGILSLLFLFFLKSSISFKIPGSKTYKYGIFSLSLHFAFTSSLISTSLPFLSFIDSPLLKAFGSLGIGLIAFSFRANHSIDPLNPNKDDFFSTVHYLFALMLFSAVYFISPGFLYLYVQSILGAFLLIFAFRAKAPAPATISICLASDLLSAWGITRGFPTNLTTHYTLFIFLTDSFSIVRSMNSFNYSKRNRSLDMAIKLIRDVSHRFGIKRISYSYFDANYNVINHFIRPQKTKFSNETVPQIMARVLTTGRPILRMKIDDPSHRLLKKNSEKKKYRGDEYSIFPLYYHGKTLGTLNLTNYPTSSFTDPMECQHLLLSLQSSIPILSESLHLDTLKTNTMESLSILQAEKDFEKEKTFSNVDPILTKLSKHLDLRIIVSKANFSNRHFETFMTFNYNEKDAKILQTHTPRISSDLLTSPANLSLLNHEIVFIDDITRLFPVYSNYVRTLFKTNKTKSLFIAPLNISQKDDWGVCWIEMENKVSKPPADLESIGILVSEAIERILNKGYQEIENNRLLGKIKDVVPSHVIEKLSKGIDPIEPDEGFLLNIDLSGSTPLSKKLGPQKFSKLISNINSMLIDNLSNTSFLPRMVIWDAFIFTSSQKSIDLPTIEEISKSIQKAIQNSTSYPLGFRGVLHYGDITRNISTGTPKSWAVVGSALAESCKIEAANKDIKNQIMISNEAKKNIEQSNELINKEKSKKEVA